MVDKRIVVIPAGRRRFMEILVPYVLESETTDEVHVWFNPRNEEDENYIRDELPMAFDGRIPMKLVEIPNRKCQWSINCFYHHAKDEKSVYLKLDDDDIWFSPEAIDRIFEFRLAHPEYFLVSPLVINNGVSAYMLADKLKLGNLDRQNLENEYRNGFIWKNVWWFMQPRLAIAAHELLLENSDDIKRLTVNGMELDTRFSINAISWFGSDMKGILDRIKDINDDEFQLSYSLPHAAKMKNFMMGDVMCAHYAFGKQLDVVDKTNLLERYRKLEQERHPR